MSAKGKARDKSMSKLGNRMITTMLKNEKLAEKELEKKMKALKDLERKSMIKICETSLDVKYDFRRKRNTQEIEEQLSEDHLNLSLGQGRLLLSHCGSRRGSLIPTVARQKESKETESSGDIGESHNNDGTNPAILFSSETQQAGTGQHSERSGSPVVDEPETSSPCASPVGSPPSEDPAISEAESQKLLKVFAQSERGAQRRRTAPEITDLSPKLLIQLAKSSAEIKRRGSTYDALGSAAADGEEQENETLSASLNSRRRGSAAIELLQSKGEQGKTEGCPTSPSLRRRGSSAVSTSPSNSTILQRRRGSSANAKISLSLETNQALLRDKISGQAPMSPRLKQPLSPLLGRRGSGMAATLRPLSAQSQNKDSASEPMLPDLKRPQSPSLRSSLSPLRANRPVSPARSLSSLSTRESTSGESQLEAIGVPGEYNLMRRRGSRPGLPTNLAVRRGSELSQVELNTLAPNSPLRKAMQDPQATLNPVPASPNAYRRHSGTVEALQDRVNDFLKTLPAN